MVSDFPACRSSWISCSHNFRQDVLIEECLPGREISAAILGDRVLPLSEISYADLPAHLPRIVTYEAKWSPHSAYYLGTVPVCPAEVDEPLRLLIEKTALAAFNALDCRDYARVDFRLSQRNIPHRHRRQPQPRPVARGRLHPLGLPRRPQLRGCAVHPGRIRPAAQQRQRPPHRRAEKKPGSVPAGIEGADKGEAE